MGQIRDKYDILVLILHTSQKKQYNEKINDIIHYY